MARGGSGARLDVQADTATPARVRCKVDHMRLHFQTIVVVALCFCACGAFFAATTDAQTIDEVIARHIEARGGAEKIAEMKTVRQTGQLDMGGGQVATLISEQK